MCFIMLTKRMDFDLEASSYKDTDGESDADAAVLLAHRAAAQGEINLLVQAIQEDPSVLEQEDGEGCTPLTHAVQAQQMGVVKRLVKMGANTNAQDGQGRTCLSIAAYQGWYDGVMYLLRNGAKQNIPDKSGRTPLHASTYDKDTRIIGALLQTLTREEANQGDIEKMTGLHWSAFHNRPEHAQMLILRGADISCQDVDGKTPLHWAAQNGSAGCCHILVQNCSSMGEFVNQQDVSGKNAIHYAVAAGHHEVLQELATVQGCELEAEDPDDRTPLHWAAAMGHPQCVSILLKLGVTPNPVDMEGGTPLDYARQSGHNDCKLILEERLGIKPSPNTDDKKKIKKSGDTLPFKIRKNPIGVLKDLFRPKHKKTAAISMTNNNVTNESIEMTMLVQQDTNKQKQKSNRQKNNKNSIKGTTNIQHNQHKMDTSGQTNGELGVLQSDSSLDKGGVPKITLTSYDVEGILNASEKKKKMKKSKKTPSEELASPGRYDNIQSIGSRVSPMLPPVMGPRITPLPPITPLPEEPPPRKKSEELAPLRVPKAPSGSNKLINDKVAALRKEKEGSKNRSPTPPPNIWAAGDKTKKHTDLLGPRPSPSPLINDTTYKEHDFYKQSLQKNTSPWLQVDDRDLLTASSRSKTGESFTTSSSLSIPSASSEVRKLSSLQEQSGYNSTFRETPRMTAMEKKALDRTIQSLLH